MSKPAVSVFIFLSFLFFCFTPPVFSQSESTSSAEEAFDFDRAYKDYVYIYELYKKAHADYLLARSQYLQAQTLASQTKAQEATVAMLEARDDVVITYFTMIRLRLAEAEGVSETDRNGLFTRLDSEIAWFKNHRSLLSGAGTLEDVVKDSQTAAAHFTVITPLIYESLATIPIGQIEVLKTELNLILSEIKTKTDQIRTNGDHDTTLIERWIIQAENKLTRGLDKEVEAQSQIYVLQTLDAKKSKEAPELYEKVITFLNESNQLFREASANLREIIKLIKTA